MTLQIQEITVLTPKIPTPLALLAICISVGSAGAIVNGTTVTVAEQTQKGLITVSTGCSGVLIVNDWALTAGHCANTNRLTPKNLQVTFLGTTISADAIYLFGG